MTISNLAYRFTGRQNPALPHLKRNHVYVVSLGSYGSTKESGLLGSVEHITSKSPLTSVSENI